MAFERLHAVGGRGSVTDPDGRRCEILAVLREDYRLDRITI